MSDQLNCKSSSPSYRYDPIKMTDLVTSIFATHHPNWADIQAFLNILLIRDEKRLVQDKASEEAQSIHQQNPDGAPDPTRQIPLTEPNWDPNGDDMHLVEHYNRCILEGMREGVPKQKSLSMVQVVQQKPTEDSSEFLERIYQAYRKYTDLDPQAPENVRMVNMTYVSQSAPDIRKKLQKLEG